MALNIKKLLVSQPKPTSEKSPYFDIAEKYGLSFESITASLAENKKGENK